MKERPQGQPPKILKPGVQEKFLHAISKGATYSIACSFAGIIPVTLQQWKRRAEALFGLHEEQIENHPDKPYYDFYWKLKQVESYAVLKLLDKIDAASNIHWQAAAWKLERRHPEDFGRYEKERHDNNEGDALSKAKDDVARLKGNDDGRSTSTESGSAI